MDDAQKKAESENVEPAEQQPRPPFDIKPRNLGLMPGLSYDNTEQLIEFAEGPWHR